MSVDCFFLPLNLIHIYGAQPGPDGLAPVLSSVVYARHQDLFGWRLPRLVRTTTTARVSAAIAIVFHFCAWQPRHVWAFAVLGKLMTANHEIAL